MLQSNAAGRSRTFEIICTWAILAIIINNIVGIIPSPKATADDAIVGRAVFLDPGHNGAYDSSSLSRQVPNGRGGMKDCQTTGTSTDSGYPEHLFNWEVVLLIRDKLESLGVHTALSRESDAGIGPCVDQRAAEANAMHPDAIVSIHADGGPSWGSGFHVNYSSPPLNDAQKGPALQLANTMRDALRSAGFEPSDYVGGDGLYGRADLAGLNFSQYPAVLVELGNMRNQQDTVMMTAAQGRDRYAQAVTTGVVAFLQQSASQGTPPS